MKRVLPAASKRDHRTSVGGSNASVDVTSAPVPFSPYIALSFFSPFPVIFSTPGTRPTTCGPVSTQSACASDQVQGCLLNTFYYHHLRVSGD